jgi:hypothetical protein
MLRTAMVDATDSRPDLDPDRAGFTTAVNAARDRIIHRARGTTIDRRTYKATTVDLTERRRG